MKNFLGNNVETRLGLLIILVGMLILYVFRYKYASTYAPTWDIVDFALGVERFDLLEMRPHFPGYPYFILGGILFNQFISDPVKALTTFNITVGLSSVIPMYLIAKRYLSVLHSSLYVFFLHSFASISILSTQAMSETAAIAFVWWYIWSLVVAFESKKLSMKLLPLFFLGMILGIRLSYLPFAIGVILLWWQDIRYFKGKVLVFRLGIQVFTAISFQMIWILGLAGSVGGIENLIRVGLSFTQGHFNEWGGAVSTSQDSLLNRFSHYVFENIVVTGFFGGSVAFLLGFGMLALLLFYKSRFKISIKNPYVQLLLWLGGSYFIWAFFAQNIDKARHIAPLITVFGSLLFFIYMYKSSVKWKQYIIYAFCVSQLLLGMYWMHKQAVELPPTYELAYYLKGYNERITVYTWEETRVMEYLQVPYNHKKVWTYEHFINDLQIDQGERTFITNRVISGFESQGINVSENLKEVVQFEANPLLYPIYHKITLYEWVQ